MSTQGHGNVMTTRRDIQQVVLSVINDCTGHLRDCAVAARETVITDLQIDSLRMVQIVFELETSLAIELPEHALFQLETVGDLIDLVRLASCPAPLDKFAHQKWPCQSVSLSSLPR